VGISGDFASSAAAAASGDIVPFTIRKRLRRVEQAQEICPASSVGNARLNDSVPAVGDKIHVLKWVNGFGASGLPTSSCRPPATASSNPGYCLNAWFGHSICNEFPEV